MARFNASGQRVWCTYLDGLATAGAFQTNRAGDADMLIGAINTIDGYPEWLTYYGTTDVDNVNGMFVDRNGNLLISGTSFGPRVLNTPCSIEDGEHYNVITKFSKTGQRIWSTYYNLGLAPMTGTGTTRGIGALTGGKGNAFYARARGYGYGFATPGAFDTSGFLNASLLIKFRDTLICLQRHIAIVQHGDTLTTSAGFANYSWFQDDSVVYSGSDSFILIQDSSARYQVWVSDSCGCSYQSAAYGPDGIRDLQQDWAIRL